MAITAIDEATTWVAKHQERNLTTHRYTCVDPFDKDIEYSCTTSSALILEVARSYQEQYKTLWRRRLGVRDF